jgi:hypothetical protein
MPVQHISSANHRGPCVALSDCSNCCRKHNSSIVCLRALQVYKMSDKSVVFGASWNQPYPSQLLMQASEVLDLTCLAIGGARARVCRQKAPPHLRGLPPPFCNPQSPGAISVQFATCFVVYPF